MIEPEEIMKLHKALLASSFFPFPENGVIEVSDEQGVYIIYGLENEVMHVGTTKRGNKGLNQRLYNHIGGTSSFRKMYLKQKNINLRNGYKFKFIVVSNSRTRALLEALTAGLLCPSHFGTGAKKETS